MLNEIINRNGENDFAIKVLLHASNKADRNCKLIDIWHRALVKSNLARFYFKAKQYVNGAKQAKLGIKLIEYPVIIIDNSRFLAN